MNKRFTITVSEVYHVIGCAEKLAQEARGLYGCHMFESCPNCTKVANGFEGWGSNGHMQFAANNRQQLTGILRHLAKKEWNSLTGGTIRYHFIKGGKIHYRGN